MLKHWIISTGLISCLTITGCAATTSAPTASVAKATPSASSQSQQPTLLYQQHWAATEINGFQVESSEKTPQIQFALNVLVVQMAATRLWAVLTQQMTI